MGIGAISISTSQKKDPAGAPFVAGSARNGTSIDSTGRVVLGNDVLANDAVLLSNRWVPMAGFNIAFVDVAFTIFTEIAADQIRIATATSLTEIKNDAFALNRLAPGDGRAVVVLGDGNDIATFGMDGNGVFTWNGALAGQYGAVDMLNGRWQIGFNPGGIFNGAQAEVVGSLTFDYFANIAGGVQALSEINDKGKLFTDDGGAAIFTLPGAAVAINGLHFKFCVSSGAGITVQADAATPINVGGAVGTVGGTVSASAAGSYIELVYVSGVWVAASVTGAWTLT